MKLVVPPNATRMSGVPMPKKYRFKVIYTHTYIVKITHGLCTSAQQKPIDAHRGTGHIADMGHGGPDIRVCEVHISTVAFRVIHLTPLKSNLEVVQWLCSDQ